MRARVWSATHGDATGAMKNKGFLKNNNKKLTQVCALHPVHHARAANRPQVFTLAHLSASSDDAELLLELDEQVPIRAVALLLEELLQRVDRSACDSRVEGVGVVELPAEDD